MPPALPAAAPPLHQSVGCRGGARGEGGWQSGVGGPAELMRQAGGPQRTDPKTSTARATMGHASVQGPRCPRRTAARGALLFQLAAQGDDHWRHAAGGRDSAGCVTHARSCSTATGMAAAGCEFGHKCWPAQGRPPASTCLLSKTSGTSQAGKLPALGLTKACPASLPPPPRCACCACCARLA